jgi:hypothetical protein
MFEPDQELMIIGIKISWDREVVMAVSEVPTMIPGRSKAIEGGQRGINRISCHMSCC